MKRLFLYLLLGSLTLTNLTGCDDAESPALDNAIYLVDAADRDSYDCITMRMADREFNVTVRMTNKKDVPVKVTLALDEDALAAHNAKFDEALKVLPADNWALLDSDGNPLSGDRIEVTIPAGRTTAVFPVQLKAVSADDTEQYALPLSIANVSEPIQVLDKQRTALYMFQSDFETPAVFLKPYSVLRGEWNDFPATNSWTVEFHFTFDRTVTDNIYGQVLTFFGNVGAEGLYVRPYKDGDSMDIHLFGTFGVASFSVAEQKWWSSAEFQGRWHHFAFVCNNGVCTSYLDGVEMASSSSAAWLTPVHWTSVTFSDQNHTARMGYSEFRVWSVARSIEDIKRNKYQVNPNSKGLFAYWKLNEGEGDLLKDATGNGHDIDASDKSDSGYNQIYWGVARNDSSLTSLETVEGI